MDTELDQLLVEYTAERTSAADNRCIMRLSTSAWSDSGGLHFKRTLRTLRRWSTGHNLVDYEVDMVGALDVCKRIVNLHESADGIYSVVTCNESHDFETGYLDDYDLKLVPYVPVAKPT